jgi:hypothetical protein
LVGRRTGRAQKKQVVLLVSMMWVTYSVLLFLVPHLVFIGEVHAAISEGPSGRISLYIDSLTSPCSYSNHNDNDGQSKIRDQYTKDMASASLVAASASASSRSDIVEASRDENFKKVELEGDGERHDDGSLCRIRNFMESSVLSVSDCSSCFGLQQLVVYDQGTSDVLVQVNDFCAKCETFSFARAKVDEGRSVSLLVEQRCVDINPSFCQRSKTVFTVDCGFDFYRPEGYAKCLPCPNGMLKAVHYTIYIWLIWRSLKLSLCGVLTL